jgi:hypothetical protein
MSRLINNFTDKYTSRRYELIERQGDGGEVETADIYIYIYIYIYIKQLFMNTNFLFKSLCQLIYIKKQVMFARLVYFKNKVM